VPFLLPRLAPVWIAKTPEMTRQIFRRFGPGVAPHFEQTAWNRFGAQLAKRRPALCGGTGKTK